MPKMCSRWFGTSVGRLYRWVRVWTEHARSPLVRWAGLVVCLVLLLVGEARLVEGK